MGTNERKESEAREKGSEGTKTKCPLVKQQRHEPSKSSVKIKSVPVLNWSASAFFPDSFSIITTIYVQVIVTCITDFFPFLHN